MERIMKILKRQENARSVYDGRWSNQPQNRQCPNLGARRSRRFNVALQIGVEAG
jgi:hypothetical protein